MYIYCIYVCTVGRSRPGYDGSMSEKNSKNCLYGENRFAADKVGIINFFLNFIIVHLYYPGGDCSSSNRSSSSVS
jgi:hypothetical protein